jgi:hypothetical protein
LILAKFSPANGRWGASDPDSLASPVKRGRPLRRRGDPHGAGSSPSVLIDHVSDLMI